jgi:chromate transporter
MKQLKSLFVEFLKLGFITFGGGIAMLPLIKRIAIRYQWIMDSEWEEVITLSQLAPGAIAVNCANLIGYRVKGRLGSVIAMLGMVIPPMLIITILAIGFESILEHPQMIAALRGMFIVVFMLYLHAVVSLGKLAWQKWWMVPFSLLSFAFAYFQILHPGWILLISLVVIVGYVWWSRRGTR